MKIADRIQRYKLWAATSVAVLGILLLSALLSGQALAATILFYPNPLVGNYQVNSQFNIDIGFNGFNTPGTLSVTVRPSSNLQYVSTSFAGHPVTSPQAHKTFNGGIVLTVQVGKNGSGEFQNIILATMSFKATSTGPASLNLSNPSTTQDSDGEEPSPPTTQDGSYTIQATSTPVNPPLIPSIPLPANLSSSTPAPKAPASTAPTTTTPVAEPEPAQPKTTLPLLKKQTNKSASTTSSASKRPYKSVWQVILIIGFALLGAYFLLLLRRRQRQPAVKVAGEPTMVYHGAAFPLRAEVPLVTSTETALAAKPTAESPVTTTSIPVSQQQEPVLAAPEAAPTESAPASTAPAKNGNEPLDMFEMAQKFPDSYGNDLYVGPANQSASAAPAPPAKPKSNIHQIEKPRPISR
jgi:hypothetical protein